MQVYSGSGYNVEVSLKGVVGNSIYYARNMLLGDGTKTEIRKVNMAAMTDTIISKTAFAPTWAGIPDYANNRLYFAGEAQADADAVIDWPAMRMMVGYVDLADDSIHMYRRTVDTGDCNEIISLILDSANGRLIAGERSVGGDPGAAPAGQRGCGIWTIPIATIADPATWARVNQMPGTSTVNSLAIYGGRLFASQDDSTRSLPLSGLGGAWRLEQNLNALGQLLPHPDGKLYATMAALDFSALHLMVYDGAAWAEVVPTPAFSGFPSAMVVLSDGRILCSSWDAACPVIQADGRWANVTRDKLEASGVWQRVGSYVYGPIQSQWRIMRIGPVTP